MRLAFRVARRLVAICMCDARGVNFSTCVCGMAIQPHCWLKVLVSVSLCASLCVCVCAVSLLFPVCPGCVLTFAHARKCAERQVCVSRAERMPHNPKPEM